MLSKRTKNINTLNILLNIVLLSIVFGIGFSSRAVAQLYLSTEGDQIPVANIDAIEFVRKFELPASSAAKILQDHCTSVPTFERKVFICWEVYVTFQLWCYDRYSEVFRRNRTEMEKSLCSPRKEVEETAKKYNLTTISTKELFAWGLASDLRSKNLKHARLAELARDGYFTTQFLAWDRRADIFVRRTNCAADIPAPQQNETRFCSYRVPVAAHGSPHDNPSPQCGTGLDIALNDQEKNTIRFGMAKGAMGGPLGAIVGGALGTMEVQLTRAIRGSKDAPAGCGLVCAIVPSNYQVKRVVPFASETVEEGSSMIEMPWGPTRGDHEPTSSEFSDYTQQSFDGGTAVCSIYKNWKNRDIRDAHVVVYAERN